MSHPYPQPAIDNWGTPGPVEDFDTGFLGQSDEELRHYCRQFLEERGSFGTIPDSWMAVLDENSATQSVVVLYYGIEKSFSDSVHEYNPEIPGTGTVCDDGYIWWKSRIPFRHAYSFFTGLDHCGEELLVLYCRPEYVDSDGVLDVETIDRIMDGGLPDTFGILEGGSEASEDSTS